MDAAKRQALEAAGWKCGDAEDFLGTNEARLIAAAPEMFAIIRRLATYDYDCICGHELQLWQRKSQEILKRMNG